MRTPIPPSPHHTPLPGRCSLNFLYFYCLFLFLFIFHFAIFAFYCCGARRQINSSAYKLRVIYPRKQAWPRRHSLSLLSSPIPPGSGTVPCCTVMMSSDRTEIHGKIYDYQPPSWAESLKVVPKSRAKVDIYLDSFLFLFIYFFLRVGNWLALGTIIIARHR